MRNPFRRRKSAQDPAPPSAPERDRIFIYKGERYRNGELIQSIPVAWRAEGESLPADTVLSFRNPTSEEICRSMDAAEAQQAWERADAEPEGTQS